MARGHPPRSPLRRCACSGQSGMRRHIPPPSSWLPPGGPAPPPPPARQSSGLRRAAPGPVPGPVAWLRLSGRAAARCSAAAPGPPPPRCGLRCGSARLGPGGLALVAPVALAGSVRPAGRPPPRCGLPPFPWAVPRCGSPRGRRARPLPSLVPRSVGGLGPLRAPPLPARASCAAPPRFSRPPARAVMGCGGSAAAAAGAAAIGPLTGRWKTRMI